MRGLALRKIEHDLVNVAPTPAFRRIISFYNGMLRGVEMSGRVFIGRIIAAADMTAGPADPQMQPDAAGLEALLAAERARRDVLDLRDVLAGHGHVSQ